MVDMSGSIIPDFYNGRSVFITGATGFIGKILVEKLVRSCPDISSLYLLIRPTSTKNAQARLQDLINCEVFQWLRENKPDALKKLVPVSGDVSLPDLGVATSDIHVMAESVSVVFHSAARVKFDSDLRNAMESNVKGPKTVANFCRQLKDLKAFVHVSTAFNNLDQPEIAEEIYPASLDPQNLMDLIDSMDDRLLASITQQLVGNCPNVYAYTKALGEQLLQRECVAHSIPLVIVRPSIVTAAVSEPLPGWIDNLNGPTGIILGIGKGIVRSVRVNTKLVADLIPVDLPVNLMIAAAWDQAKRDTSQIQVYNCSSGALNPITWEEFRQFATTAGEKLPFKEIMWYPDASLRVNRLLFQVELGLYHYLPGFIVDTACILCGRKPFLTRLYKKAHRAMNCLEFYTMRQWHFVNRNAVKLIDKMSTEDRKIFNFDVRSIDWPSYMESYVHGVRTYLVKDESSTLPLARNNLKKMKRLRTLVRLVLVAVTLFYLSSWLQPIFETLFNFETSPNRSCNVQSPNQVFADTQMKPHLLSQDLVKGL